MNGAQLEARFDDIFEGQRNDMTLRLHRAISWVQRAEFEIERGDTDAAFIFYWIAFNAAYAKDVEGYKVAEKATYEEFFSKVVELDKSGQIYKAIYETFAYAIWGLINNKFVFDEFWKYYNGIPGYEDWEAHFSEGRRQMNTAFYGRNSRVVLDIIFSRLYMLRGQIFHGSATWNSSTNRRQVEEAAAIMAFMVPVFVERMLDNPEEDWGKPFYPVLPNNVLSS